MIQPERIRVLNDQPVRQNAYVLYWMQASQRSEWNHALEYAIEQANASGQPVVVLFGLTDSYPEANERHYAFMLEGLRETQHMLAARGITMVVRRERPDSAALSLAGDASLLVTDRGYTRIQRRWREQVGRDAPCRVVQVETDAVVPAEVASEKEEYSAATIRRKINRHLDRFLIPLDETPVKHDSLGLRSDGEDLSDVAALLRELALDRTVGRQAFYTGGASEAKSRLEQFVLDKLQDYAGKRNDPSLGIQSNMSPYLHFGQISPLFVALTVRQSAAPREAREAYLEELIVRRELSLNFVYHNARYDSFDCLPQWAQSTLEAHRRDRREYVYSLAQLEGADTHDPYWNAAMREMIVTGKMHNYMRMYWGKKILEWSPSPGEAFETAVHLNNRYFLDGRDPNSYAGVAWVFGKHDRPWGERPIFGKVRYMNANGLRRKFDMNEYVRFVEGLPHNARREEDG
jgi:deoxyribodipyrimidine photo-lyase